MSELEPKVDGAPQQADPRVGNQTGVPRGVAGVIGVVEQSAKAVVTVLSATALAGVLLWLAVDYQFFKDWLKTATHAELFGVKIERTAIDEATADLQAVLKDKSTTGVEQAIGEAAIRRSARVASAIVGAKVLWVDDDPKNNEIERRILRKQKFDVTTVRSTEEAFRALRRMPFDLIISDVWREGDQRVTLDRCRVHYFDYPDPVLRAEYEAEGGRGLIGFNADQNERGPAGFSLLEQLVPPPEDGQMIPRVVFYAGVSAAVVRSLCGDKLTNRPEILLQTVVSLLEEQRWERLISRD